MHGAGNDFVVLDCRDAVPEKVDGLARHLCDRHFGIGADGLLLICKSRIADFAMRIINADGSEAQMCGNGIRCIGKYIHDRGIKQDLKLTIETLGGIKTLALNAGDNGQVETVTVDMGEAIIEKAAFEIKTASDSYDITAVSTGNPHGVVFTDDCNAIDIETCGPQLECHAYWPEKTNIEFVTVKSRHNICQRTWERGVGQTLACGTGAIAAATSAVARGLCDWPVSVKLDGGTLIIDRNPSDGHIYLTGPADEVFSGIIP